MQVTSKINSCLNISKYLKIGQGCNKILRVLWIVKIIHKLNNDILIYLQKFKEFNSFFSSIHEIENWFSFIYILERE